MYVYRKTNADLNRPWEVGYFAPDASFKVSSRHHTPELARRRVNYLNGGTVPVNLSAEG